jgi:hypothetical protein
VPYPEWRIEVTNRAQKAGLGCVGKGMEWILGGEEEDHLSLRPSSLGKNSWLESGSGRGRGDTMKSAVSGEAANAHEVVSVRQVESGQENEDLELSDCEWEGECGVWIGREK